MSDSCPNYQILKTIESSLDRLNEAAWFIRKMEEHYHEADQFRWSLSSFLRVKFGQRYVFPRSRVVDWTYLDKANRRMVGNYTLCALLTKESKAEADAMKKRFKLDCAWLQ